MVCAIWLPELSFTDGQRSAVDESGAMGKAGAAACYLCAEERGNKDHDVGMSVGCSHDGCAKRMHVTCALKRGLLPIGEHGVAIGDPVCELRSDGEELSRPSSTTRQARKFSLLLCVSVHTYVCGFVCLCVFVMCVHLYTCVAVCGCV